MTVQESFRELGAGSGGENRVWAAAAKRFQAMPVFPGNKLTSCRNERKQDALSLSFPYKSLERIKCFLRQPPSI